MSDLFGPGDKLHLGNVQIYTSISFWVTLIGAKIECVQRNYGLSKEHQTTNVIEIDVCVYVAKFRPIENGCAHERSQTVSNINDS